MSISKQQKKITNDDPNIITHDEAGNLLTGFEMIEKNGGIEKFTITPAVYTTFLLREIIALKAEVKALNAYKEAGVSFSLPDEAKNRLRDAVDTTLTAIDAAIAAVAASKPKGGAE
jgi:hypothetical protein